MKLRKLAVLSLLGLTLTSGLTACGGDSLSVDNMVADASAQADAESVAAETTAVTDTVAEGQATPENTPADTSAEAVPVETDADGNPIEPTQSTGRVSLNIEDTEEEETTPVPIVDTELGTWLKTKDGFKFKSAETGEYVTSSLLSVDGYQYCFDSNGLLRNNLFVPTENGTMYIKDYQFVYGFIEVDGDTYYITPDEGRAEACKAKIDGELWCFDSEGKVITEEEWDEKFGLYESSTDETSEESEAMEGSSGDTEEVTETSESTSETTTESAE